MRARSFFKSTNAVVASARAHQQLPKCSVNTSIKADPTPSYHYPHDTLSRQYAAQADPYRKRDCCVVHVRETAVLADANRIEATCRE